MSVAAQVNEPLSRGFKLDLKSQDPGDSQSSLDKAIARAMDRVLESEREAQTTIAGCERA
jgi:hypothetical protein